MKNGTHRLLPVLLLATLVLFQVGQAARHTCAVDPLHDAGTVPAFEPTEASQSASPGCVACALASQYGASLIESEPWTAPADPRGYIPSSTTLEESPAIADALLARPPPTV